jgi:alginate O-acetyltransferase complex protein AlgI
MLFNSIEFLIFFPIVTLLFYFLPHRFRWFHLLLASCVFYMFFIPVYILILFFTIIVDYFAGILIENAKGSNRKFYLILSLIANIGVLAVFKYYNFFIGNFNMLAHQDMLPLLNIILPIGLSFHTFQAMSYTIEVYKGNQKPERHFGIYALYVMFYPQLVAGPIERPQNLLSQFRTEHHFNADGFFDGMRLMLWGFFKKVVIADRIVSYVDAIYGHPSDYMNWLNCLLATFFFTIQIYCDFSAYSDIAIGAAKCMGFDLMTNFKRPYSASNIHEFWGKWHISLSTWFKDYLYIPLGGSRKSKLRKYLNQLFVFLVSGFWHGANWTFILWGAMHGGFNILYQMKKDFLKGWDPFNTIIGRAFAWVLTFTCVLFAWAFFRATTIHDATLIVSNILTFKQVHPFRLIVGEGGGIFSVSSMVFSFIFIAFMFLIEHFFATDMTTWKHKKKLDFAFCTFILTLIISFGVFQHNSFIYFQF